MDIPVANIDLVGIDDGKLFHMETERTETRDGGIGWLSVKAVVDSRLLLGHCVAYCKSERMTKIKEGESREFQSSVSPVRYPIFFFHFSIA